MPAPSNISPNTGNYQVGKGIVSFKKSGAATYRDLGNVTSMVITPDMTTLDHFSSREGVKKKDLTIITEKGLTVKIVMEEYTAENMAMMLLGTVNEAAEGGPTVQIFDQNEVTGALRFVGTNEVGPQVQVDLWNVSFQPDGDFEVISDEFNNMEVSGNVLVAGADDVENAGKFGQVQILNIGGGGAS